MSWGRIEERVAARQRREHAVAVLPGYVTQAREKLYALLLDGAPDAPASLVSELVSLRGDDLAITLKPLLRFLRAKMVHDRALRKRLDAVIKSEASNGNLRFIAFETILSASITTFEAMRDYQVGNPERQAFAFSLQSDLAMSASDSGINLGLTRAVIGIVEFVLDFDMVIVVMEGGDLEKQIVFNPVKRKPAANFDVIMPQYLDLLDLLIETQRELNSDSILPVG